MTTKKRLLWGGLALVLLGVAGAALVIWRVPDLRWRAEVVGLVATGRVQDLGFVEALHMLKPGSGYWLEGLVETRNAYMTISNPFVSAEDVAAGMKQFRQDCAACHGADGHGREVAPALIGRALKYGDSDWAMFNTVRRGIAGTSMPPHDWDEKRIWSVIAYLRSIGDAHKQAAGSSSGSGEGGEGGEPQRDVNVSVPGSEIENTPWPGKDWLAYSGSYSGTRHSQLTQIDHTNVARLAPKWLRVFDGPGERVEASPIVRDGIMFLTRNSEVLALDALTGTTLWRFNRSPNPQARGCCGNVNRGVAILDDRLFVGTTDAHLIALDVRKGKPIWDSTVVEFGAGYAITGAPIAYRDLVVIGVSGGDYPTTGFVAAFDVKTGKERWRFKTIPGKGEPGNETWAGESWKQGGGATWLTGSYDPQLDILYWGVGNAAPAFNATGRAGDNLFTNSVLALRGTTGQKLWHFQFTPNDDHDWDSVQIPVIADRPGSSKAPKQLLWANRNGFFYALNRETGEFLAGAPFVHQTWAEGLDPKGRPIVKPAARSTPKGTLVYPSVTGGTNWWSPSYDPKLDLMLVPSLEYGGMFFSEEGWEPKPGQLYLAGATGGAPNTPHYTGVIAIKPDTGEIAWKARRPPSMNDDLHLAGLVSTAGGVTFASDDQLFYALDSSNGNMLWSFPTGSRISASPITFEAGGKQYVFVAATKTLIAFALVGD